MGTIGDLGMDIRGKELNSAARKNHNLGANKKAIFQKEKGGRGEGRNWIVNFTRWRVCGM